MSVKNDPVDITNGCAVMLVAAAVIGLAAFIALASFVIGRLTA